MSRSFALVATLQALLAALALACSPHRTPQPVQLPDDVPSYPGWVQTPFADAWRGRMPDVDLGTLASYTTDDKPGKVLAYYRRELEARGWRIEDGGFQDELASVHYGKELRGLTIWVFRDSPQEPTHLFLSATERSAPREPSAS